MPKVINLEGKRIGRLTVLSEEPKRINEPRKWKCLCDCGKEKVILQNSLTTGKTVSCGCYSAEKSRQRATKHNLCGTKLYNAYHNMIARCYRKKHHKYPRYGARGIKVCNEWLDDFKMFAEWAVKNGYRDGLTIDRIDVNGNYEPSNCRWTTYKEQMRNTTRTNLVTYNGKTKCLTDWAEEMNVCRDTLRKRIKRGYPQELWFVKRKIKRSELDGYRVNI